MRKSIVAMAGVVFLLTGCSSGTKEATQNLQNTAEQTSATLENVAANDTNAAQANMLVNESVALSNSAQAVDDAKHKK